MVQIIAFLFLLLAADLDSLSGKVADLRLIGVTSYFKATFSLHTTLPFHAVFPFCLQYSHIIKCLSGPLLAMVHIRQYLQEFHAHAKFFLPIYRRSK